MKLGLAIGLIGQICRIEWVGMTVLNGAKVNRFVGSLWVWLMFHSVGGPDVARIHLSRTKALGAKGVMREVPAGVRDSHLARQ